MTRKHYVTIARALREAKITDDALIETAYSLADAFSIENPRFDRVRFLNAAIDGVGL